MEWEYEGKETTEPPPGMVGFVYAIIYDDKTFYIGKKLIKTKRRRKPLVGMRKNARRMVDVDLPWRNYEGSAKIDMSEKRIKKKQILVWCKTKKGMSYYEAKILFDVEALTNARCLNGNILGKFYRRDLLAEGEEVVYKV